MNPNDFNRIDIGYRKQFKGIVDPTRIQIDPTLSKQGYAAEAKATGKVIELAGEEADRAERAAERAEMAYKPFNESWAISGTTLQFCENVRDDENATAGKVYLGKVYFSDLPNNLVQAECIVEIISNDQANGKDIHLILSSGDTAPYHWEYNYVMINGSYVGTGWKSYLLTSGGDVTGNIAFQRNQMLGLKSGASNIIKGQAYTAGQSGVEVHIGDYNPNGVTQGDRITLHSFRDIVRQGGLTSYNILDELNTSANPTLFGNEKQLTGLKVNGVNYKLNIAIPDPPTTGNYVLKSSNGVLSWETL